VNQNAPPSLPFRPFEDDPRVGGWPDRPLEVQFDRPPRRDRLWLHATLFLLTFATTLLTGVDHYAGFIGEFGQQSVAQDLWALLPHGLWYSATILGILGAHEMGHYLACRYYRIDATLPFFIPFYGILTGTFGAVIKIREPILAKRALFDIGIAGPIAGFVVAVPALFVGVALSTVVPAPTSVEGLVSLGEPLLFQWATKAVWGTPPEHLVLNMHPMAFAAWFGLIATALNLFPIAQLDGGHISYAVFGRRSTLITYASLAVALTLTALSLSWLVWTVMIIAMLALAGARHPRVLDEDVPLDRARIWLALFALAMFVVCFTPAPIELVDLLGPQ
jgi:membrane-associated protease RseP (regulator of RpoE activity)